MNAPVLVDEVMTTRFVTLEPHFTVGKALRLIEGLEVRHLPVLQDGRLVGVVSDRDLREFRKAAAAGPQGKKRLELPVSQIMNRDLVWVEMGRPLAEAVDAILHYGIGAVPVVDPLTRALMGLVSYVNVLQAVRPTL